MTQGTRVLAQTPSLLQKCCSSTALSIASGVALGILVDAEAPLALLLPVAAMLGYTAGRLRKEGAL